MTGSTTGATRNALRTAVVLGIACAALVRPGHAFAWNPVLLRPHAGGPAVWTGVPSWGLSGACARSHWGGQIHAGGLYRPPSCAVQSMVEKLQMSSMGTAKKATARRGGVTATLPRPDKSKSNGIVMERDVRTKPAPAGKVVTMGGVAFGVVDLLLIVDRHGGGAAVTKQRLWKSIARELGVNTDVVSNASTRLRVLHDASMNRLRAASAGTVPSEGKRVPRAQSQRSRRRAHVPRFVTTLEERSANTIGTGEVTQPTRRTGRDSGACKAQKASRRVSSASTTMRARNSRTTAATSASGTGRSGSAQLLVDRVRAKQAKSAAPLHARPAAAKVAKADAAGKSKKCRTKKTRGGTRKGLQKGLESISSAVALPDEVQDDVDELTRRERVFEYLSEVGVGKKNLDKVLEAYPQLQHLSVIQNLRPTIRFLTKEIGIAPEMVRKVIVSFPQILGLSVDDNLRPTVQYLRDDVRIPMNRLNKTIVTRPQILGCSVDKNLAPKLELLVEMAGIDRDQLPQVIVRAPHVLGYSPSNIARFLIFLLHELGIDQQRVARIVTSSPQLLGLSLENNLRPKIQFLVEEVGISEEALGQVIGSFPNILGYSVEQNMRPKLEYLADDILKVPMAKLGRPLEKCPQLLGYSLEKRIKPRFLLLQKRGLKLGLSRMLAPTDLEFRRILRIHDAALKEENRASQAANAAIRAYSWAQERQEEEDQEDEDETDFNLRAHLDLKVAMPLSPHVLPLYMERHMQMSADALRARDAGVGGPVIPPVEARLRPRHEGPSKPVVVEEDWVAAEEREQEEREETEEPSSSAPVYYWH